MKMLKFFCLCGQVQIEIPRRPDFINFHPSEVGIAGTTRGYSREDKDDPAAEVHFCANCGSTTHFTLTSSAIAKFGNSQTGVNLRLADERDLAGIELRYPDGRAWSGKGGFGYVQEARIIGR
jgi:hypothetical protein